METARLRTVAAHVLEPEVPAAAGELGMEESQMEAQAVGAQDGFTHVSRKGGRRAKKRQAEEASSTGEGEDAGRMDTDEPRPAKRPVFPPLSGDAFLVLEDDPGTGKGPLGLDEVDPVVLGDSVGTGHLSLQSFSPGV